jgi:hypothetical protein
MSARVLISYVLPALAALPLGFLGLALAAQNEPSIPAAFIVLLSPGLKLAELMTPGGHTSLGVTFGWFLRIGIGLNALYYFTIFTLLMNVATRRRRPA